MNIARTSEAETRLTDLLATDVLSRRSARLPDLDAETAAFCTLSKVLADDPRLALRQVLVTALRLCNAGSAGLSSLRPDEAGENVEWTAISGALSSQEGRNAPRANSSCGACLDAGAPILLMHPERTFSHLHDARPAIIEELIVPLHD